MSQRFGKYELVELIGRGGMAEVFKAQSVGAEGVAKTLVIKRIRPELASDKRFVELFISEAKLAMELNHPNIVQIYDFGKVDETYYLAMEYIDGVHLGRLLRAAKSCDWPMEVGDAVYIAIEVAKGLDYAHRRSDAYGEPIGLVHRDISPQNVMVSRDGAVKLLDFGIAQTRTEGEWDQGEELVGKVRYMSPEQARGENLDQRSDLFGLGAVLFEMVSGRPLFDAPNENEEETRQLVCSAVVPDLGTVADIPESLEHVLYKALTGDRDQRIESAREFQVRLTRVLYEQEEIHDGATVAEYVAALDEKIVKRKGEKMFLDGTREGDEREQEVTVVTGRRQAATPGISWKRAGRRHQDQRPDQVTRQKKEVTLIHGQVRARVKGKRGRKKQHAFAKVVESIAYKHDAIIHGLQGWEFTLLLGIPMATEADATRAARMCLLIKDAIRGLRLSGVDGDDEQVSMVVVSEKVLLEEHIEGRERHYEWSLSSDKEDRFRKVAQEIGSMIAVDQAIRARIERRFCARPMTIEGESESYYELQGPKSIGAQLKDLRRSFEHFHGRELEQRIMRTRLRSTLLNEQAGAMIWVGDAGVGKSTLMEGFLSDLSGDEVRVVRGVATPAQRDIPLASATALFSEMLGLDLRAGDRRVRGQLRQRLDELFGEPPPEQERWIEASLLQLLGLETASPASGDAHPVSGVSRRQQLFSALKQLANRLARQRPLVIAIDDVEYIDPVMMQFAAQYFDQPRSAPVFFVGTAREGGEVESRRAWKQLLAARFVQVENLPELSHKSSEELVRGLLAMTGRPVDDEVVDELVERSGGNPLYIHEVVEAWRESDDGEMMGLPASIEGLLEARLDRMARQRREDLRRLALLPEPFSKEIAHSALRIEEQHIEELIDAGLLQPADRRGERYQFESEVMRRAAARGLLDEDLEEVHAAIAEELLKRRERYEGVVIAHHLEEAGQRTKALEWYEKAIEEAYADWGSEHCLQLCEDVLERPWIGEGARGRILGWKAAALRELGASEERRQTLRAWSKVAEATGDLEPSLQVMVEEVRFFREEGELERARGRVEKLRSEAQKGEMRRFEARAWRLEAVIDLSEGRRDRALTLIDRAIASLHQLPETGEQRVLVESYVTRGVILRQSGRHREALESYETALMISQELKSSTLHRQLLINSGLALAYVGEFSEAKRRYSEALEICQRLGHRRDEALVLVNLGHLYEMLGRAERAVESTRRGIYLAREAEDVHTEIDGIITLGLAYLGQGKLERAQEHLEEGWRRARALPHVYMMVCALLGKVQLELIRGGDEEVRRAETMALEALELSEEAGLVWGGVMGRHLLAQGHRARGAEDEARVWSGEAVDRLEGLELYGEDAILMGHIELMEPGQERKGLLDRVTRLTEIRIQNIDDIEDREAYESRDLTQRILDLAPVAAASE